MANILVNVVDQELHFITKPKIAAQGVKENYVVFTFDETWTGFTKIAVFMRDDERIYQGVDSLNKALIPSEFTAEPGYIKIGVYGTKDNVCHTSILESYKIVKGLSTIGG